MENRMRWMIVVAATLMCGGSAFSAITESPRSDFFERKIRPVLLANCYKCHAPAAGKPKGGLDLTSRQALLKGGDNGPAIVPGDPEHSKLVEAIRRTNKDLQMPPKTPLPEAAVADLTQWVRMGAPWGGGALKGPSGPTVAEYDKLRSTFWSWQRVRPVRVPAVKDASWPAGDVDRFVLAKLEENGLHPVGPADKYALLRRVTFDLTGLPPTPEEIEAFVNDPSPNAYTKVVDRLLASPAFGERWGRHWLDVARYADSTGSTRNYPYAYAWRYRNYVIDSFNQDKPYNQFITEQIAGDLLPYQSARQHDDQLVATGFLALGVKDLNEKNRLKYTMDNVDEQIDVVGKSILGLTISCARCHDHKFDPIPQADYYKLAGIFRSTDILCGLKPKKGAGKKALDDSTALIRLDPLPHSAESDDSRTALDAQITAVADQVQSAEAKARRNGGKGEALVAGKNKKQKKKAQAAREQLASLRSELDALEHGTALAIGVHDAPAPGNSPIYQRGEPENPGPVVSRGMISLCRFVYASPIPSSRSGRLELARWMASRDNPLTTRVVVNRIWHNLFGQGIVRTTDNFGTTGELPSHPELLDCLATRFVNEGWSTKKMVRELVLSRTYQLASTWDASDGAVDPSDLYLWRMSPRRLEAEEIRDALLADAGDLDTRRPAVSPAMSLGGRELRRVDPGVLENEQTCRSVYLPIFRDFLPPMLDHFDFANPEMVTGTREVTTVAPQALFLMNDPFVLEQSRKLAERLTEHDEMDDATRVGLAYRITYGRPATAAEVVRARQYLALYTTAATGPAGKAAAWAGFCQALFASAEFRYVN